MMQGVEAGGCLWLRRRLWIAALAVGLGLTALGVVSAGARSDAPRGHARAVLPLRAVMYETAPTKAKAGRPAAAAVGRGAAAVRSHLAALAWARADAAIVRWHGRGTASDRTLAAVLAGIVSTRAHVRAAALIDGARGNARAQLRALARLRVASRGYLRIRVSSSRLRGAGRSVVAGLRAGAALASGRARPVARAGRLRRVRELSFGCRRVVSRRPRRSYGASERLLPDPAGLLAEQHARAEGRAFDRGMATLDPAHGRLAPAAADDRFAQ